MLIEPEEIEVIKAALAHNNRCQLIGLGDHTIVAYELIDDTEIQSHVGTSIGFVGPDVPLQDLLESPNLAGMRYEELYRQRRDDVSLRELVYGFRRKKK